MGKTPKGEQQVTEYSMGLHFGVALELDAITAITINEKVAWEGRSTTLEAIEVNRPDLYGGNLKGGGVVGKVYHLPGREDQVLPESLAALLGKTSDTAVAYRGLTSIWFTGDNESEGFIWGANNPLVAQTMAVTGECAPKTAEALDPAKGMIGKDANPAHIIFECMTSPEFMAGALHTFNIPSFAYAADVLIEEEFGMSLAWMRQTTIQEFVSEILDHIQGVIYLSPRTGLWTLKLLRDDYAIEDLRVVTPDNGKLTGFKRALWGELINELTVTWTNPLNEQDETYTAHDLGAIQAQDGQVVAGSRNYYGIRRADLAMKVAWRDVRASSAPLVTGNVEVNRQFWNGEPGEVIVVNYPDQDLDHVVCRIMAVDYGKPGDSTIKLSLLQDIFSLEKPFTAAPEGPGWEDPSTPPEPIAAVEIVTTPYYFVNTGDFSGEAVDLEYPEVISAVFGYQDDSATRSFNLMSEDVSNTGLVEYQSHGLKPTVERILLPVAWSAENSTRLPEEWISRPTRGPKIGGFVWAGALHDYAMEILHVVGFDDENGEWILARGALDTIPRSWPVGTPLWFVNPGMKVVDNFLRSAGEDVKYKLLTRTSMGTLPIEDAPAVTETLNARPHLPLRPANFKINDVAYGDVDVSGATDMVLTWSTRNRMLEDGQVLDWTADSVPPEYAQATVIKVFDDSDTLIWTQGGLWTQDTFTIPKAWFARWGSIHIYALSVREDFASLQAFGVHVVGLPNNPSAPPPPEPEDFGPAPSPDPAPEEGAWSVVGHKFDQARGGEIPAIVVAGQRDRSDAAALVVRYKLDSNDDWFYMSAHGLTDEPTQVATTAVKALTKYDVEIAYQSSKNVLSLWRSLGDVTTGRALADDTANVGNKTAQEVQDAIDEMLAYIADLGATKAAVDAAIEALRDELLDALPDFEFDPEALAQSMIERAVQSREIEEFVQARTLIDSQPIGPIIVQEQVKTASLVQVRELLGLVVDGGSAFALSDTSVKFSNGELVAAKVFGLSSTLGGLSASLVSDYYTKVAADAAIAAANFTLLTTVGSNLATALTSYYTKTQTDSAIATADIGVLSTVAGNLAGALTSYYTKSQIDASEASLTSAIYSTVASNLASALSTYYTKTQTDSAISAANTTLLSTVTGNIATATSGLATTASLTASLASLDSSIKAWVNTPGYGGNPLAAAVDIQGTAVATLTGQAYGRLMLYTNANGNVAGISILSSSGVTNISAVVIEANSFQIKSGTNSAITPLTYDAVTGKLFVQNVVIRNADIADLAVTTLKVANGNLYNSVFAPATSYVTLAPGEVKEVVGAVYTGTGGKLTIAVSIYIHPIYAAVGALTAREVLGMTVQVYRTSTPISNLAAVQAVRLELVGGDKYVTSGHWMSFVVYDQPAAGTNFYFVSATGGDVACAYDYRTLLVEENKAT